LYLEIQQRIRAKFVEVVQREFGLKIEAPTLDVPPSLAWGDLSIAACFELARQLSQPPRTVAERIASALLPLEGVERVSVAGGGYLNFYLDRAALAWTLCARDVSEPPRRQKGKILVEHTSINPNKAAHIGHLRNAVLGDTFARLLRFRGYPVEVQNYIDNTGVQVADVVVGLWHLEKKSLQDVERLIHNSSVRFDYYCWELYARVFKLYEQQPEALKHRSEALQAIEKGQGELAALAELVSTAMVKAHLETMQRINVQYDLLVQESEILRLEFWKQAFQLLRKSDAVRFEEAGKNAGCWVMRLAEAEDKETDEEAGREDVKIIVRSDGTVTYVGKDIAYHLWKFGLLGKEFGYQPFHRYPDGRIVWRTALEGQADAPAFGAAAATYAVIDSRQSYLQNIVVAAFRALGYQEQAENLHHFAYEVVGLSPRCAEEMGVELSAQDRQRSYVEVSGRKGLGIKADDLIDALISKARQEVEAREMTDSSAARAAYARMIAVAALRYFLLKFSRRVIIAFDFKEALAFEGETGPYLLYSVVRARNIFRKFQETHPQFAPDRMDYWNAQLNPEELRRFLHGDNGSAFSELVMLAAQLEMVADQAISTTEPSVMTKYAFRLAQAFNNFYHRWHILSEPNPTRQHCLLFLVHLVSDTLSRALDLMGIEIPEHM